MWITDCDPYTEKRLGFQSKRKRPVSESFTTYRTFTSKLQTGQYAAAILTDSGRIKNEFRPWSLRAHFSNFSNALSGETEKVSPKTFLKASWLLSCFARCEEKTLGQRISAAIGKARDKAMGNVTGIAQETAQAIVSKLTGKAATAAELSAVKG